MNFEEARRQFPVLDRLAYLNAGTFGPLARATVEAMAAHERADAASGRSGPEYFERMLALRERVREKIGGLLGVEADRVALTASTTDACSVVVAGLDLGPEDEVVTTDGEHFGLTGPLHASRARVRVARVVGRPAAEAIDAVLGEVTPRTRLIAVQHVSWKTGHVLDVAALRAAAGVPVLVDGAQSAGAIAVEAGAVDFYTVSAQKWLCGPDATGAVAVRDPEALRVVRPSYFSQASYDVDGSFEPKPGAARFDTGWIPPPALAGLEAALDVPPSWRFERAAEAARRCRELLEGRVDVVTEPGHATLVTFRARGDATEIAARAYDRGVVIRDLPGTGWLRASCGWWTSDEDLERLVAAVA